VRVTLPSLPRFTLDSFGAYLWASNPLPFGGYLSQFLISKT
jgi:hypothetical protein